MLLGLPPLAGIVQQGRDPQTARFVLLLTDGRKVRIGTQRTLRSQTEFAGVTMVALDCYPPTIERRDWNDALFALLTFAKDVEEVSGEDFTDTVTDWLRAYAGRASADRNGAAAVGDPFRDGDHIYVKAAGLARYARREYSEQVKLHELRQALRDLDGEQERVHARRSGGQRTTISYYRLPLTLFEDGGDS